MEYSGPLGNCNHDGRSQNIVEAHEMAYSSQYGSECSNCRLGLPSNHWRLGWSKVGTMRECPDSPNKNGFHSYDDYPPKGVCVWCGKTREEGEETTPMFPMIKKYGSGLPPEQKQTEE